MQRNCFLTAILGLIALAALGATCSDTSAPGSDPATTATSDLIVPRHYPTPGPTPPWKSIDDAAFSAAEAAGFARDTLGFNPPFRTLKVKSMEYAEATVGEARAFFNYSKDDDRTWDVAGDVPAEIFVVYGTFECYANRFSEAPTPQSTAMWIVVPLGVTGTRATCTNATYDLSQLSAVFDVPLPLPPFPTPVSLDGSAAD